ncbi:MAG: hypothetical protein FJY95_19435 [Candidatus Handelsmanbacteria bacterium]|nr:hypothetical protein [Candidatus Handelsmanbacteria bacterium]
MKYTRRCLELLLAGCLALVASAAEAQTAQRNRQFLNLGATEEYLNYGRKEYDPYPSVINARNKYDRLGNFLSRGFEVFSWEFSRPGLSNIDTRTAQYLGWFNNLIILSDTYRGWNYSVTMGEDIRAKLSNLTMKDPRFFGVLFDGASSDNKFTFFLSQGGDLLNTPKFSTFRSTKERSPVLIFGGHWETKLGNVLQLGATYFNQHMANTFDQKGSFLKGDTPYSMIQPTAITIIVEDDSPDEPGTPAVAFDMDIVITGESRGQAVRLTSIEGDANYDATLEPVAQGGTLDNGGRRVVGGERVTFQFKLPDVLVPSSEEYSANPDAPLLGLTIKAVHFEAQVAGDYRISVQQQYPYFNSTSYQRNIDKGYKLGDKNYVNPFTGLKGNDANLSIAEAVAAGNSVYRNWPVKPDPTTGTVNPYLQYKWDLHDPSLAAYTVARSNGKGKDLARKRVSFEYGIPTGQALYGLDGKLVLKGLTLKGEFVTNPQYFIFPVGSNAGNRFDKRAWGYFLTGQKQLGFLELGAEWFKLDPDYSGDYDSVRGGVAFFTDECGICPQMQEFNVMADNDDNDQWPDEFGNERLSAEKTDSGIFPGLDDNQDLVPDSDQNINGIPDWTEPILFYDSDPPEFIYGVDFNNNGMVDFRENDALPDYPYRRDRRGLHLFVVYDKLGSLGKWASLGVYRTREPAGGNKANAFYLRYEHEIFSPYIGHLRINDDLKLVKDGVRDDTYIWRDVGYTETVPSPYPWLTGPNIEARDLNTQLLPPSRDPLSMRNSLVNTFFLESRVTQLTGFNIVNTVQWVNNAQKEDIFDDGTTQESGTQRLFTLVNKVDYTLQAGNLTVRPMYKNLILREKWDRLKDRQDSTSNSALQTVSMRAPILRTKYVFTPKTSFELAFQGLPFWRQSVDRQDRRPKVYNWYPNADLEDKFKEWTFILMMSNRSDHYGYSVSSQFGWIKTDRKYDDELRKAENFNSGRIFFDIVAGF